MGYENIRVVCFMTYLRAGSKLFHSLLDRHPQILCFPRTLRFNNFWQKTAKQSNDIEYIVDFFINANPRFFSGLSWYAFNKYDRADQLGPSMNETFNVDVGAFRKRAVEELRGKSLAEKMFF